MTASKSSSLGSCPGAGAGAAGEPPREDMVGKCERSRRRVSAACDSLAFSESKEVSERWRSTAFFFPPLPQTRPLIPSLFLFLFPSLSRDAAKAGASDPASFLPISLSLDTLVRESKTRDDMSGPAAAAALLSSSTAVVAAVAGMPHRFRSTSVGAPRTGASQRFDSVFLLEKQAHGSCSLVAVELLEASRRAAEDVGLEANECAETKNVSVAAGSLAPFFSQP